MRGQRGGAQQSAKQAIQSASLPRDEKGATRREKKRGSPQNAPDEMASDGARVGEGQGRADDYGKSRRARAARTSCGYVRVVAAIFEMAEAATMEGREMSSTLVP